MFNILVQVREAPHIDGLNYFKQDENLETELNKSLGFDTVEISRMFGKSFDRVDLVRLGHFAIEEANQLTSGKKKRQHVKRTLTVNPVKSRSQRMYLYFYFAG